MGPINEIRSQLVALALGEAELFHSTEGVPYVQFPVRGHRETHPVASKQFMRWLGQRYYQETKKPSGTQAISDAVATLEGSALYEAPEFTVHVRVAAHGGKVYLDLADREWSVVEVSESGWRTTSAPPVRFLRPKGLKPLPLPVSGGRIEQLRSFLNVTRDADWRLLVAWLLQALGPTPPYPILLLQGEQGAAKSVTARLIRSLVDPHSGDLRRPPRDPRDLAIAAQAGHILALDNLSSTPQWLSDALCCLSTGGAFATRQLHTDAGEAIFAGTKPVILTSIGEVATAPDLLDRAVLVTLSFIPDERRISETELWDGFGRQHALVLGALLDVISAALRHLPSTSLPKAPRMADFARWVVACEPALGWEPGSFLAAYNENRQEGHAAALEASVLGTAIPEFVRRQPEWRGNFRELQKGLEQSISDQLRRHPDWPATPERLAAGLKRIAPNLRAEGIEITILPKTNKGRIVQIRTTSAVNEAARRE